MGIPDSAELVISVPYSAHQVTNTAISEQLVTGSS